MPATGSVFFHGATSEDGFHLENPVRIYQAARIDDVEETIAAAEAAAIDGCFVAGYVAYEAGAAFEKAVPVRTIDVPYAWFGVYESASGASREKTAADAAISHVRFSIPKLRYRKRITDIRALIREGDVYQINYTGQLRFDLEGSAEALFDTLAKRQPVPFAAYLDIGEAQIVSCSPELFFRRDGQRIVTRPMKGTAIRGSTDAEDEEQALRLASDEKNRAENLMIVDLLRNDLSRCCTPGSVRTPRLFETERYETLIQMSSEIEGELYPGTGLVDIFRALFPCGSITGAPKIRAMQRIDALEDEPRGVYCGAVGMIKPGGDAVFNVAIRTALVTHGVGRLGIGSGVVWDSDADSEFAECLLKARFLTGDLPLEHPTFYLIETMMAEEGRIPLLDMHLDRLAASAAYFDVPFGKEEAVDRILAAIEKARRDHEGLNGGEDLSAGNDAAHASDAADRPLPVLRVRLTLDEEGAFDVTLSDPGPRPERWRVAISGTRIDSQDPLRRHKTSRRAVYTEKYRKARELGFDEVLFLNQRDEVAEGSRSNVFIREGRAWRTPPIGSGALPGVYRRHLIDTLPGATEEVLYIKDVLDADAVYFSNAVMGLVEAEIVLHHDLPGSDRHEAVLEGAET